MSKTKTTDKQAPAAAKAGEGFSIAGKKIHLSTEEKICSLLILALVFLVYAIRSNFLLMPFERDEGIYSYFGNLILEGKIPYKDFYESKFPGLFYLYAFMVKFFGDTVEGMHTGFMWMNILTMLFIYFAARSLFSPIAGIISAITYAFVSMTPNLSGFTVQSEQGVAFFTALGFLFFAMARKYQKFHHYFLMGIAMAMAFMVKTSGVFLVLWGGLVVILDWLFSKPRAIKNLLLNVLGYSAGGILILAIFFTIIYLKGSFSDMIWWTYTHSKDYVSAMKLEEGMTYFRYTRDAIIQNHKFFWAHSFLACALILFKGISWRDKLMGITLLGFSFLTIVPGFYFYGHYWIQVVPGLALVAGLTYFGIEHVLRTKLPIKGAQNIKYVYLTVFILISFSHMSKLKSYYFHPNYELILRQVYGNNPFPEAMEIGNFINSHTGPEDNITLIGSEPQIYFYTRKRSPSRHAYFTAIVNAIPQHKSWQREWISDVERQKPKYIVFFNHPFSLLVQKDVDNYVFQWANKYIMENYKSVGVIDMIEGQHATYVWDPATISTYKPTSTNVIYIFERNPGANPLPTDTTKPISTTPPPVPANP